MNLALLLVASAGTLYAGEAVLRVALDDPSGGRVPRECARRPVPGAPALGGINVEHCRLAAAAGLPFDTRSRLQVIQDLERDGIDAWPTVVPRRVIRLAGVEGPDGPPALPLGGVSGVATVYCNESGVYATYRSDEFGFRNPRGAHAERDVRAVVIGDSFAAGSCVADGHTVGGFLRRTVGPTVTLAGDGNGPLLELALLREYAAPLEPDFVVWLFFEGNDLGNLSAELEVPALRAYLDPAHRLNLRAQQVAIDSLIRTVIAAERRRAEAGGAGVPLPVGREEVEVPLSRFLRVTRIRRSLEQLVTGRQTAARGVDAFDEPAFERVMREALRTAETWHGRLVFVYLPAWERFARPGSASPDRAGILATARRIGIPVLDVTEVFARHEDPLSLFPFRLNSHYTEEGYALVAGTIARWIDVTRAGS